MKSRILSLDHEMKCPRRERTRTSFTLMELLVVIAIITILVALFLPALQKAREKTRQIVCTSNLKQLGVAFSLYMSDYNGRFPHWWYLDPYSGNGYLPLWDAKIAPYLGFKESELTPYGWDAPVDKSRIFQCPQPWQYYYPPRSCPELHYAVNYLIGALHRWNGVARLSQVTRAPAEVALILENGRGRILFGRAWNQAYHTYNITYCELCFRHSGGMNILFLDNHVEWVSEERFRSPGGTEQQICYWWCKWQ